MAALPEEGEPLHDHDDVHGAHVRNHFGAFRPQPRRHRPGAVFVPRRCRSRSPRGTNTALFGLSHGVIDQAQYSYLVATVIGSAVIPTMIGNAWFLPQHLIPALSTDESEAPPQTPVPQPSR